MLIGLIHLRGDFSVLRIVLYAGEVGKRYRIPNIAKRLLIGGSVVWLFETLLDIFVVINRELITLVFGGYYD